MSIFPGKRSIFRFFESSDSSVAQRHENLFLHDSNTYRIQQASLRPGKKILEVVSFRFSGESVDFGVKCKEKVGAYGNSRAEGGMRRAL